MNTSRIKWRLFRIVIAALLLGLIIMLVSCSINSRENSIGESKSTQENTVKNTVNEGIENKEISHDVVSKYIEGKGYTITVNSFASAWIKLPNDFTSTKNGTEIGKFLKERNIKSKELGFDFSNYMGKEVAYVTCGLAKDGKSQGEMIAFLYNKKIVGAWIDINNSNETSDHLTIIQSVDIIG